MSALLDYPPLVTRVGFTLVHFLWQGTAIAIVLRVILAGCRGSRARYNWSFAAMAAMAAAPVATFCLLGSGSSEVRMNPVPVPMSAPMPMAAESHAGLAWTGVVVAAWAAGALLLAFRACAEFVVIERLRRGATPLPKVWAQRCEALAVRLGVRLRVAFAQSNRIAGPIVTGFVKSVILIPTAALTSMPVDQLEALILHELAHVRRFDAIANLVQAVVEILLFYHPAVWWVSRTIRQEREHCCDDVAVAELGDPAFFVRALQNLAQSQRPSLAIAASGGSLATRVRRLLAADAPARKMDARVIALAIAPLAGVALGYAVHASASADPAQSPITAKPAASEPRAAHVDRILSSSVAIGRQVAADAPPPPEAAAPVLSAVAASDGTNPVANAPSGPVRVLDTNQRQVAHLENGNYVVRFHVAADRNPAPGAAAAGTSCTRDSDRYQATVPLRNGSRQQQYFLCARVDRSSAVSSREDPLQAATRRLYASMRPQSYNGHPLWATVPTISGASTTISLRPFSITGPTDNILFLLDGRPISPAELSAVPSDRIAGVEAAGPGSPGGRRYGARPDQSLIYVFTRPPD